MLPLSLTYDDLLRLLKYCGGVVLLVCGVFCPGRWAEELRRSYHEEACGGLNYARTADSTTDVCLVKLLNELSEDEYRHAELLMKLLGRKMNV